MINAKPNTRRSSGPSKRDCGCNPYFSAPPSLNFLRSAELSETVFVWFDFHNEKINISHHLGVGIAVRLHIGLSEWMAPA
jgi:hypothetical protein